MQVIDRFMTKIIAQVVLVCARQADLASQIEFACNPIQDLSRQTMRIAAGTEHGCILQA